MSTMLENARKMIAGELPPAPMASLIGLRLVAIEPGPPFEWGALSNF